MCKKNKIWRIFRFILLAILVGLIAFIIWFAVDTHISPPKHDDLSIINYKRENPSENFYKIDKSWLRKSESGLWELYVEGKPFEVGIIRGMLTKELIKIQEKSFVDQIKKFVPSSLYLSFLRYFIAFFNRDIDEHIIKEYQLEIYGISLSASKEYEYIADNYQRMLNYHAAHDIGHALKDLAMVGCTSFSQWDDTSLIIGRNFDFYINDDFAKNKVVAFINPENGYKFISISWASMIGVVSGMNEKGLTVTINAAKSDIPTGAATPISILAREILQYASNIEEAINIAKSRETFVSESIMIGSSYDNKTIIIEKSPSKLDVLESSDNSIFCTNHFQTAAFQDDILNIKEINESASMFRFNRCTELVNAKKSLNQFDIAKILRDKNGMNDSLIGIGNEKAINQMISHHSVIFFPNKRIVWVSTPPFQLGKYVAYDLNEIFDIYPDLKSDREIYVDSLTIPSDPFLYNGGYQDYKVFVEMKIHLLESAEKNIRLKDENSFIEKYIGLNPDYFISYTTIADYYYHFGDYFNANRNYELALSKEISTMKEKNQIESKLTESRSHLIISNNN